MQIKVLPAKHNCPTTKLRESKMATQGWVADRLSEWVKHNPSKGAKDAKEKVEQDLYPDARSYIEYMFKWHMKKINDVAPDAMEYLERDHNRIWYRSGFSEASKCDYLTNNVSESFNAQIRHLKGLLLHELVDGLRELFMEKRYLRKQIGGQMEDGILPNVLKELNTISKNL